MAQTTSELWKTLWRTKNVRKEYGFDINGVWYGPEAEVEHSVDSGLYEEFGFGNAAIAQLTLSLYADDIPRGATIKRYIRLVSGEQVSEWLPKGVFFTNRRTEDDGYWTVEAYDAMRKAENVWEPDQFLEFPLSMPDAAAEFARIMGVEIDPRTALNPAYTIDYPANDYTIRNELCYIAAAHGGNWIITDAGMLYLVPLLSAPEETDPSADNKFNIGLDITSFSDNGKFKPVSRVTLLVDNKNAITAGDDTGMELAADCPNATQEMADALLTAFKGYQYQAYSADAANIDPAAELGDGVTVNGIYSVISRIDDDGSGYPGLSAPGEEELEDEYPAAGPMTQAFSRQIAETHSTIAKTAEEIRLEVANEVAGLSASFELALDSISAQVQGLDDSVTALDLYVGGLTLSVSNGESSSTIKLMSNGAEIASQEIKITGFVTFAGLSDGTTTINGACIKTGTISADRIDVSNLKVDTLWASSTKVAISSSGDTINIGGRSSAESFSAIKLYGDEVYFTFYGVNPGALVIDTLDQEIRPSNKVWSLGTSSYIFKELYTTYVYTDWIGSSSDPASYGFFTNLYAGGNAVLTTASAVTKLTNGNYSVSLSTTPALVPASSGYALGSSSYYWATAYITKLYLSSTCYITAGSASTIVVGTTTIGGSVAKLVNGSYSVSLGTNALTPGTSGTYSLGSSSYYWNYLYVKTIRLYYSSTYYIDLTCNSSKKLCVAGTAIH